MQNSNKNMSDATGGTLDTNPLQETTPGCNTARTAIRPSPRVVSHVMHDSHLTIDNAPLSRRSTVPTPNRDTSNILPLKI